MIYINKSKDNQFYATVTSESNGEILSTSETETQKHNIWKNIFSQAHAFRGGKYFVTDRSLSGKEKVYDVELGEKILSNRKKTL